ncbi:transglycosylase domain-containing protein [Pseudonocardia spinosispora]|uniref:transglycosylase domain-containing protein n=1 Tax=Pseudonocardia spinosispora TaxID=103441 RepID=UPI001FE19707|nr:transglycosylase domain-containing protein [Pseudonocardia spinosispora]
MRLDLRRWLRVARSKIRRRGPDQPASPARSKARLRWVLRTVLALAILVVLVPAAAFGIGWYVFPAPTPDDVVISQIAKINFSDGKPMATVRPDGAGNRVKIALAQVPQHVQQAVLSAEDRSFFSNPGFDIVGIARAAWAQLTGRAGGGSTITQQYIKLTTGQDQHSFWRKYKEVIGAAKIAQEYSKERILEDYLNTIYLGRGAYGIQAAAQAYFGVDTGKLTVSQGALLAGLIQSPSRWDPATDPGMATQRWNYVLDGMVAEHWLSPADRAAAQFPQTLPQSSVKGGIPGNHLGHVVKQVQAELTDLGITEQSLTQDGLTITTTVDEGLEQQAADISAKVLKGQLPNLRTALVAVDPRTGGIVAYYGGDNGVGLDYARVLKQPGSSFKPFVMTAALLHKPPIGIYSYFDGSSPQTIAGQTVSNSDGDSCDECDLKEAMTKSINTIFYQLGVEVGPPAVAAAAHQAGIPANLLPNPTAGISLGDKEVRPGDMASAYATFAAGGVFRAPHLITKVETADGRVLVDNPASPAQLRIDPQVARNVTESMLDVAGSSLIPLSRSREVAAKTGTTQSHVVGQNNDGWTVGYTPTLSTAVWVGTNDNSPIKTPAGRPIYGRMVPGSIWQQFMNAALSSTPPERFPEFQPLGEDSESFWDDDDDDDDDHGRHHGRHHRDRDSDDDDDDSDDN